MTAEIVSAEDKTEVAVPARAYRRLNVSLPLRFNMMLNRAHRGLRHIQRRLVPEQLQFWFALRRLQRAKLDIYEFYEKRHEEYREVNADAEQMEQLNYEEAYELRRIDEKIHQLCSQHIILQAERYFVAIPEFQDDSGDWEAARISGRLHLRREVLVTLRSAIRGRQNERQEAARANLIWVMACTGLVGAVTGLISVLGR